MRQPNILYLVCHDLGRHLGCYGAPVASPRLDALARAGIRFDRAYCTSTACSPSRACAMTGRYAHATGAMGLAHMGWPLASDVRTVIEDLHELGYQTAHVGLEHEWHPRSGRYEVELARHWDDWQVQHAVDDAIAFLSGRDDDRPFYLNVGFQEVHACRFTRDDIVDGTYGGRTPPEDTYVPNYVADTASHRRYLGGFQSAIGFMDHHVGRLLDALDASPHGDDTLVVFTTDHGIAGPGVDRDKGTCYLRGLETALIVRPPRGLPRARVCRELIQNIDLRPTLVEAAGGTPRAEIDGRSFWPLLAGEAYTPHALLFAERNFHGEKEQPDDPEHLDLLDPIRSLRDERFHYLRWFDPGRKRDPQLWLTAPHGGERDAERLYDVEQDAMELVDLARRPEYRHVLAAKRLQLVGWMQRSGDWALDGEAPTRPEEPGWGDWPHQRARTPWRPAPAGA